jgi:hypothetical protein
VTVVPNVCNPSEDNSDATDDSFCEELEHVFDQFSRYHMNILLCDFNAKMGREDILKQLGMRVYLKLV